MQSRERIVNSLKGKEVDRIPWSPFLAYFWEHQSPDIQQKGQLSYLEEIGADPFLRGANQVLPVKIKYKNCEITERQNSDIKETTFRTSIGELKMVYRFSQNSWFISEHPVKTLEDLKVFTWLQENTELESNARELNALISKWGEHGLVAPLLGLQQKSSFQSFVEQWFGTEELVYKMMDYPDEMKACLNLMHEKSSCLAELAVDCDAEYFISWEDTSTTNISPRFYEDYILPEINNWCDILHRSGKKYIQHACGHLKDLVPLIAGSRIDAIESVSPPPTGNIEFEDVCTALPENMAIIGGIEPVFFEGCSMQELKERVSLLSKELKGKRFVLANSDSCPPGVSRDKLTYVSSLLK